MSCHSAVGGLYSVRETKSALSQHSATNRCKCKSRMTLLLRDVDPGQIDHMAAEPTHGPHHSCSSSSWLGASDPFLGIGNLFPYGGSKSFGHFSVRSRCLNHECARDDSASPDVKIQSNIYHVYTERSVSPPGLLVVVLGGWFSGAL